MKKKSTKTTTADPSKPSKVNIHYIKTPQFRNIFVSGVYGGAAHSNKKVYMSLFSDRVPIPQMTVNLIEDDRITGEIANEKVSKTGIVRDVEANVIMDLETAKRLVGWLQHKIDVLEGKAK